MPKAGPPTVALSWPASLDSTAKPCINAPVVGPPPKVPAAVTTAPSMPPLPWCQKRPFQASGRRISKLIA